LAELNSTQDDATAMLAAPRFHIRSIRVSAGAARGSRLHSDPRVIGLHQLSL